MDESLKRKLRSLDEYELRRVVIYAQGLLVGTDGPQFEPLDDPDAPAGELPTETSSGHPRVRYRQQWVRCGKEGCRSCPHGPYWYAYWREDGRQRSRYIGKEPPPEIEEEI